MTLYLEHNYCQIWQRSTLLRKKVIWEQCWENCLLMSKAAVLKHGIENFPAFISCCRNGWNFFEGYNIPNI